MTERERKLLGLFAGTAILAVAAVLFLLGMERLTETRSSIERYAAQIARIDAVPIEDPSELARRIAELRASLEREEAKAARGDEDSAGAAIFGREVRALLESKGIVTARYNIVRVNAEYLLEFSAKGNVLAFLRFLREASTSDRAWRFPSFSLRIDDASDMAEIVFRVGEDA